MFTFDNEKNATGKDDDYNYSFIIVVTCDYFKQKLYENNSRVFLKILRKSYITDL